MSVDVKSIRELRERTQAGMSDCKNALIEAEGDMEKAVEIILKKGLAKTAKRAGAIAAEGEVRAAVASDARSATLVEVNIQTDFAARNEQFTSFVGQVLELAQHAKPGADLAAENFGGKPLGEVATELSAKLGEKIAVRRWDRLTINDGKHGLCHSYVHLGGKIAVALALETDTDVVAKHAEVTKFADDTAMQIAAMTPLAVRPEDVDKDEIAKQREIFQAQLSEEAKPKPESVWPKIVDGKVAKWFGEITLLEQDSVVVSGKKVKELMAEAGKAAGGKVNVIGFIRYQRGEGLAVAKKDDFADEVVKMVKS